MFKSHLCGLDGPFVKSKRPRSTKTFAAILLASLSLAGFMLGSAFAANPPPLSQVPIPEPPDLASYVADRDASIALGKALFWDMQVGSDGIQACATCHFVAGADGRRFKNQLSPGLNAGDETFQTGGPNHVLNLANFPFHKLADPDDHLSAVISDSNDVASSQGVFLTQFEAVNPGNATDVGTPLDDPVFNVNGVTIRRVEPRNTPTAINAVFNFNNFWDGRANNIFNGNNPFGPSDLQNGVFVNNGGTLEEQLVRIINSSLASQAVGPPLSPFEMSFGGRTWPDLGKKMLALRPLDKQLVHPQDSVLGALSRAKLDARDRATGLRGLTSTYPQMIQAAFQPRFWNNTAQIVVINDGVREIAPNPGGPLAANEFTQMEANFAFFWGLAVQMYESTLVSDDSRVDRYLAGNASALSAQEKDGLGIFTSGGTMCSECHSGAEFSNHTFTAIAAEGSPISLIDMTQGSAFIDLGMHNISVRPTAEDIGRGGLDGFGFPLSFSRLAIMKRDGQLPAGLAAFVPDLPPGTPNPPDRVAVDGAVKTPGLRNLDLTPPYMHNGGMATLRQVVDFYARGGNFPEANVADLDPDINEIGQLIGSEDKKNALVAFFIALTDDRVRNEGAPFDHPELFVPNGARGNENNVVGDCEVIVQAGFRQCEQAFRVQAVGTFGRLGIGLSPLQSPVNQFQP
ncbi:cytochrome C peroxidase [Candidatus Poribacteria bacterium]|nr:cytochrome C peroxidase [Candidatus Poribacteria bacterium]